jgi:CHASE3 domain sensor protein
VLRSLKSRIIATMALLVALVLVIAILGVTAINALDRSAGRQLALVVAGSDLSTTLVGTTAAEMRAAEQYLVRPDPSLLEDFIAGSDSAYIIQARYRDLADLTTTDRVRLNSIASSQAAIEVAYATAHALIDLGRPDEALRFAAQARGPADSLVSEVRALTEAQGVRARERAASLRSEAARRRNWLGLLFFTVLGIGVVTSALAVRAVDQPLSRLVGAADRFGGGDLRPIDVGEMPAELEQLAEAMNNMGERLRAVVAESTDLGGAPEQAPRAAVRRAVGQGR